MARHRRKGREGKLTTFSTNRCFSIQSATTKPFQGGGQNTLSNKPTGSGEAATEDQLRNQSYEVALALTADK